MRDLTAIFGDCVDISIHPVPVVKVTESQAIASMQKNDLYWDTCKLKEYQLPPLPEYTLDEATAIKCFKVLDNKNICGSFEIKKMHSDGSPKKVNYDTRDIIESYIESLSTKKINVKKHNLQEDYLREVTNLLGHILVRLNESIRNEKRQDIIKGLLEIVAEATFAYPYKHIRDLRSVSFIVSALLTYEQDQECESIQNIRKEFIKHCIASEKLIAIRIITTPICREESDYSRYESRIGLDYIVGLSIGSIYKACVVDNKKPIYSSMGNLLDAFFTKFTVDGFSEIMVKQFEKYNNLFKMICADNKTMTKDEILKYLVDELGVVIIRPRDNISS